MKQEKKPEKKKPSVFAEDRIPEPTSPCPPTHPHFTDIASLRLTYQSSPVERVHSKKQHKNWDNKNTKLISPINQKNPE
jgi:hypothetical protein